jgi:hypothetical protein
MTYHFRMYCNHEWNLVGSLALFCMVSCAGQPVFFSPSPSAPLSPVYLTDRARFTLLPPDAIAESLDCVQQIAGSFGEREFIMEAWVRADAQGIDVSFYNSFGADMGRFSFDGERALIDSPVFPPSFKAEYLAADFQFCFYRPESLKPAIQQAGLVFESARTNDDAGNWAETRKIIDRKKTIIAIVLTADRINYTNFLRGYAFTLVWGEGGGGYK